MNILDCKAYADSVLESVAEQVKAMNRPPFLVGIRKENNPGAASYAAGIKRDCDRCGIFYKEYIMAENDNFDAWDRRIAMLNIDPAVDAIIVFTPAELVLEEVSQYKDVDAFSSNKAFNSCTADGVIDLLIYNEIPIHGRDVVVIGRSDNVGKPMALTLLDYDATVTICHSKTPYLSSHCKKADIIISATGQQGLVKGYMVKPGATVIDVGRGDVEFDSVAEVAGAITPAKGGTGLATRAALMQHVIRAKALNDI